MIQVAGEEFGLGYCQMVNLRFELDVKEMMQHALCRVAQLNPCWIVWNMERGCKKIMALEF